MTRTRTWFRAFPVLLSTPLLAMLSGCMAFGPSTAGPVPTPGIALQGMVHGGQQPIVGAQIELFAAGSSGTAQGATALLNNSLAGTISKFTPNRVAVSPTGGYRVGGNPPAFCIDSADLMYVSQPSNNSIQVLSALTPAQGFTELINNPEVNGPAGLAVDASGNLWVANFGSGFSGSVAELVGIAFPTKTPIAVANQTESFEP
jgi:hypothetical protein